MTEIGTHTHTLSKQKEINANLIELNCIKIVVFSLIVFFLFFCYCFSIKCYWSFAEFAFISVFSSHPSNEEERMLNSNHHLKKLYLYSVCHIHSIEKKGIKHKNIKKSNITTFLLSLNFKKINIYTKIFFFFKKKLDRWDAKESMFFSNWFFLNFQQKVCSIPTQTIPLKSILFDIFLELTSFYVSTIRTVNRKNCFLSYWTILQPQKKNVYFLRHAFALIAIL